MQIQNLKPKTPRKTTQRVGRGGKRGTYSGKGQKGQISRDGHKNFSAMRVMFARIPKRRGIGNNVINKHQIDINLDVIIKAFNDNATISPKTLKEKGFIKALNDSVKIVGSKQVLSKKFIVKGVYLTNGVKQQIEKAGGTVAPKILVQSQPKQKNHGKQAKKIERNLRRQKTKN